MFFWFSVQLPFRLRVIIVQAGGKQSHVHPL